MKSSGKWARVVVRLKKCVSCSLCLRVVVVFTFIVFGWWSAANQNTQIQNTFVPYWFRQYVKIRPVRRLSYLLSHMSYICPLWRMFLSNSLQSQIQILFAFEKNEEQAALSSTWHRCVSIISYPSIQPRNSTFLQLIKIILLSPSSPWLFSQSHLLLLSSALPPQQTPLHHV